MAEDTNNATVELDAEPAPAPTPEVEQARSDLRAKMQGFGANLDPEPAPPSKPTEEPQPKVGETDDTAATVKADDEPTPEKEPAKPAKPAAAKPVELTERMKQGARLYGATPEQLAAADEATAKLWDDAGQKHAQAMGKLGAEIRAARAAGKLPDEPKPKADDGDGQDDPPADTGNEQDSFTDEFGDVDAQKLVKHLGSERETRAALEATVNEMRDTLETIVGDMFVQSLDPARFPRLGKGPIWNMKPDSPEYAARRDLFKLAGNYALGVAMSEGRPIGLLEALAAVTANQEQPSEPSGRKPRAEPKKPTATVHEPGRVATSREQGLDEARAQLRKSMAAYGMRP